MRKFVGNQNQLGLVAQCKKQLFVCNLTAFQASVEEGCSICIYYENKSLNFFVQQQLIRITILNFMIKEYCKEIYCVVSHNGECDG